MPMYVIFDRETGEPVHTHFEAHDVQTPREGLLSLVDPSYDLSRLEVTLVDTTDLGLDQAYRIDPATGKPLRIERGKAGFGAGAGTTYDPEATTRRVETVFERALPDAPAAE
jgi:hypothetical protein